ncbi:sulfatase-like hydrolase/transferase [Nocardioides sp.]|uniref:sulfatase-like hydrolase/transferase n=1 Tax=Nocardioides sp. TaxID=35761 RepID=UPI0027156355|nr:sulfatase-like hydrolase/transferase [Nocardioides sp.]MDO9455715.1 sulfatase-like hydrolase/transferase [Nocardioides sp.]
MKRSRLLAAALVLLLAGTLVGTDPLSTTTSVAGGQQRVADEPEPWPAPGGAGSGVRNAVVFLVDDMSDFSCSQVHDFLPESSAWLKDRGTCYETASTSTPVCCPARAQVQTGQLAHNNRVRTQLDARHLDVSHTVQHDLGEAGLTTYGVGKNLNGVDAANYYGPGAMSNGFDDFDFWNSYKNAPGSFLLYADDGSTYVPTDGLHSTETNGAFLDDKLDGYLETGERFFVYDAFFAPHKQGVGGGQGVMPLPTPAHAQAAVPPFYYAPEPEARDKLPLFAKPRRTRAFYQHLWTQRIRALYDVDHQMASVFAKLETAGVLDETAVIFASDNGYTDRGQVNWDGKAIPYPASTDVPMLAWYPGAAPAVVRKPVQLVDIAPTLYDVLGVTPGHRLDGHSLRGGHTRKQVYGEFFGERDSLVDEESGRATGYVSSWRLLKQGRWSYVEWYRPEGTILRRELYGEPRMLANMLWPGYRGRRPKPSLVRYLHQQLVAQSRCAGTVEDGWVRPCT